MDSNMKLFNDTYCIDECSQLGNAYVGNANEDVITLCMQVKELVDMRDRCLDVVLNRGNVV